MLTGGKAEDTDAVVKPGTGQILDASGLLKLFVVLCEGMDCSKNPDGGKPIIGLVGYPNVCLFFR